MIAIAWALASAVLYGVSDFLSGLQSRRRSYLWVGLVAQCVNGACALLLALTRGGSPTSSALVWGSVAAVGAGLGTLMLMKGLAAGAMHVAGPISAVFGAGLPVVVGVLLGERPGWLAVAGIVAALPAVWLVASGEPGEGGRAGLREGVLAGIGFGVYFTALARPGEDAGLWPVAVCQTLAVLVMAAVLVRARPSGSFRTALPAWQVGATGALAAVCYQLAAHAGLLTVVSVVTNLYPAITVLLAMTVLHERASRAQAVGLLVAGAAVAAIAAG